MTSRMGLAALLGCAVLLVSACGLKVCRSDFVEIGDKRYAVVEFSTMHLIGPNLRGLHTVEVDHGGKAQVVHSSAATSSGLLQAILPGGASAAIFTPLVVLGRGGINPP